jgi:hypothetical protein
MKTSYVLMGILFIGSALTCVYLLAECLSWQTAKASDHRAGLVVRELYKKLHSKTKPYFVRGSRRKVN